MAVLHELGHVIRIRRSEMGLSQARVAALCGLSRQTVNQIESGSAPDLGLNKAERLAQTLGISLRVEPAFASPTRRLTPLARAAATASVSYKTSITTTALKRILVTGELQERYIPHVSAFLDDAPVSLLAAVAESIQGKTTASRETIWKNYRRLALALRSRREIWE